jgi:hypothetical protein
MKKIINVLVLFLFILGFSTCSNEETAQESQNVLSIRDRYAITKEIAAYHLDLESVLLPVVLVVQLPNLWKLLQIHKEEVVPS